MSRHRLPVIVTVLLLGLVTALVHSASAQAAAPADVFVGNVTDDPDPVVLPGTVFYSLAVGNNGPGTATAVTLTAQLPPGVTFQPSGSTAACAATLATVTCSLPTLPAGSAAGLILAVTPTIAGTHAVSFTASAAQTDRNLSNNTQTENTTAIVDPSADVAVDVGPVFGVVYAGQPFFFPVSFSNSGPAPASGVVVTLRLPAGLVVSSGASCTAENGGSVCTLGPSDLPPSSGSVALIEMVANAGDHLVTGSVVADQPDPQLANNTDTVTITVMPAADIAVKMAESADPSPTARPLSYLVTITNHGPSAATAVSLTDDWSAMVSGPTELLSITTSQGQCTVTVSGRFVCELGVLDSGADAAVTLQLRPRGTGTVTNRAEVTSAEYDPDPSNNAATEATVVG